MFRIQLGIGDVAQDDATFTELGLVEPVWYKQEKLAFAHVYIWDEGLRIFDSLLFQTVWLILAHHPDNSGDRTCVCVGKMSVPCEVRLRAHFKIEMPVYFSPASRDNADGSCLVDRRVTTQVNDARDENSVDFKSKTRVYNQPLEWITAVCKTLDFGNAPERSWAEWDFINLPTDGCTSSQVRSAA